ncbi:PucR family transcriptional regulator [Micromonospora sp. NPDC005161]
MIDVLQELVEALAQELQRSVAVDDAGLRLLASSAHYEDVDKARLSSLVGRRVSGATRDYVLGQGVQHWHQPTILHANAEVGLEKDRLGFPLRSKYELLGFVWLLDDGTLTADEIALTEETARRIEELLTRKAQSAVDADFEIEAIVLALLAGDAASRKQAAEDLRDLGLFQRAEAFSVVALQTRPTGHGDSEATMRDAVRRGITQAMQGHLRDMFAYAAGTPQSLLIVGHRASPSRAQRTAAARAIYEAMDRFAPDVATVATIGTSQVVDSLSRLHEAFDQAVAATEVARTLGRSMTLWDDHPLESLLQSWLRPQLGWHLVPAEIEKLMQQPADVAEIVQVLLDAGGNVAEVASTLHLHRTTVYYRLNRLKESTGIDLNNGSTRLLIHLWLRGRRFTSL